MSFPAIFLWRFVLATYQPCFGKQSSLHLSFYFWEREYINTSTPLISLSFFHSIFTISHPAELASLYIKLLMRSIHGYRGYFHDWKMLYQRDRDVGENACLQFIKERSRSILVHAAGEPSSEVSWVKDLLPDTHLCMSRSTVRRKQMNDIEQSLKHSWWVYHPDV